MKLFIMLITVSIFFVSFLHAQEEEIICETNSTDVTTPDIGGRYITANGTLRILLVFVDFKNDTNPHSYWVAGSAPSGMSSFIDANTSINSSNYANVTNFFDQMSLGNYNVIGEAIYVEAPHTEVWYANNYYSRVDRNLDVLVNAVDPIVDFTLYDNWTRKTTLLYAHLAPDNRLEAVKVIDKTLKK
ncbi:MAG: hypothetical protein KDF60_14995 [Calditrichaeota bacterium]|nr:hypothetical protein [Calditrichota bacterium]